MTYEEILDRALSKVPSDLDKREGSIIYDALAPCCFELAQAYIELDRIKDKFNVENLEGDELTSRCKERGLNRKPSSKALRKGIFNINVNIGSRFSIENTTYMVTEKIIDNEFILECEQEGKTGNSHIGMLLPIDYIEGLKTASITEIIVPGVEVENDKSLRQRYFEKVRTPATSGNKYHYKNWAKEVIGVGDAKIIPLWAGKGTVKVVIVDTDRQSATEYLTDKVFDYIEEVRPIGARVTVVSAISKTISISAKINISTGYTIQQVQELFKNNLELYRKEIAFKDSYISYAAIGNILFNTTGVIDYTELKLNNLMQNITLLDEEIPIFTISLELVV